MSFTQNNRLMTRTIPYREFERVLGIVGIDDFIRYGGTMSLGGKQYNDNAMIFATKKSTDEYVDSAIARNIQHSLKNYKYIVKVNETLKALLEIKDKEEQKVEIQDAHRYEIKEYLDLLDLTVEIESRWMSDYNRRESRTAFSQPGMRYSQAEALIKSLMQDDMFRGLSFEERKRVTERIIDEIKGRMMEDIVLLETKLSKKNCEVFRLQFAIGEFNMVVFNPDEGTCEIYEIKHSKEVVPQQCKHLLDEQKCKDTEFRYGTITGKYVIYRGTTTSLVQAGVETQEDVTYLNVEEYLKKL